MDYQSAKPNLKKKMTNESFKQTMQQQKEILIQQSNFKNVIAKQKLDYNNYQNQIKEEL
jgi:hypothetical protein